MNTAVVFVRALAGGGLRGMAVVYFLVRVDKQELVAAAVAAAFFARVKSAALVGPWAHDGARDTRHAALANWGRHKIHGKKKKR